MTLRHLKIFVAVCETGSTTAASEKLYIAQPSVSLAISELESYYGLKLFDRIGKRLQITESGKHFLQYAIHIVSLFENMETEVKNLDAIGEIRIGASITIGNYFLPKYVSEYKKKYPQMQVKVMVNNSDNIQQYILSNKIDIGLIEGLIHSPYIIKQKFRDDQLIPICSPKHRFAEKLNVDISKLSHESLLVREPGSAGREIVDGILTANGIEIAPTWQSTSSQAIVKAVQEDLGISILPYYLVKDSLDRKEISEFHFKNIDFKRSFSIIYHKNKFLTQSAKTFIGICK